MSSRRAVQAPWILAVALLLAAGIARAEPEYDDGGAKSCIDCHGNPRVMGIVDTAHAKRENGDTPAAQKACESCHGPSKTHTIFPMQVENLHFGKKSKTPAKEQNRVCLDCHAKKTTPDWKASAHGYENVVCSACHSIHDPKRIVPAQATVSSGCTVAGCHPTFQPEALPAGFSHAVGKPLGNNGEVTCTGCHNPHGPLSSGRCLECHVHTPEMVAKQSEKARRFHAVAEERGTECIRCHKALAHPIAPLEEHLRKEAHRDAASSSGAGD